MLQGIYILTLPLVCLCSKVLDEYSQKAVIVSDYCPSIPGCQDGTHVMCLHYNPNKAMGPACVNAIKISLTSEFTQLIVDICNRIRSKIANGLGKGEDGSDLPRGYGMFKLTWDPELATLAEVWANQCILKLDLCRATSQIIGMSRYTVPNWMPISMISSHKFNSSTLTPDKIKYSITSILKAWYQMKDEVIADMINYFDVMAHIKHNQFLQLVSGRSTHMGCGLSGYREYSYSDNNAALNFNSIQIVCNFSFRPQVGEAVYTVKPPTEPGYTLKCGCPLGYDEDEDCLCYETERTMPYTCKEAGHCKPSVVVLPIFTVEDAPLNIIGQNNDTRIIETTAVPRREEFRKRIPFADATRSYNNNIQIIKQDSVYKTRRIRTDVKNRYFPSNIKHTNKLKTKPPHTESNRKNIHKQSIFAKAAVFELPSSKTKQVVHNENYKSDVVPRKDFSKIQKLVSKYLEGRRNGQSLLKSGVNHNLTYIKFATEGPYNSTKKVKNTDDNLNRFNNHKFTYLDFNSTKAPLTMHDIKSLYVENDQVFMNLLDKLEEEVNNIDFNTKEKELFDEKIRKIYGTLVKKSVVTEYSIVNKNISINKDVLDNNDMQENNLNRRNYRVDNNKHLNNKYTNLEKTPINEKSVKKYYETIDRDVGDYKYKNDYKLFYGSEPLYNQNIGQRELRYMHPRKKSRFNSMSKGNLRHGNYYLRSDLEEYSSLESNRRRHYTEKLNNLQHKISLMKKNGHQNYVTDRHLRPVRPSKHGNVRRRPKEMDLYMPDRARFLHGF